MTSKIRMMALTEQLPWASALPYLTAALSGIIHSVSMRNCSSEKLCHLPEVTQLESVGLSASGAPLSPMAICLGRYLGVPGWCPAESQLVSHS